MSNITVKAHYSGDLRRWTVAEEDVTYESVMARIVDVFGVDSSQTKLTYEDDEGDLVTMISEADLAEGLALLPKDSKRTFRIIVTCTETPALTKVASSMEEDTLLETLKALAASCAQSAEAAQQAAQQAEAEVHRAMGEVRNLLRHAPVAAVAEKLGEHIAPNFIEGARYSQIDLPEGLAEGRDELEFMLAEARSRGSVGFFFQQHHNGHRICGFYGSEADMVGKPVQHGHKRGFIYELEPEAASEPPRVVHPGVECDVSGQRPIVGARFKKLGEDYDLCEAEFVKLPADEQAAFLRIASPCDNWRDEETLRLRNGWCNDTVNVVRDSQLAASVEALHSRLPGTAFDNVLTLVEPVFALPAPLLLPCMQRLEPVVASIFCAEDLPLLHAALEQLLADPAAFAEVGPRELEQPQQAPDEIGAAVAAGTDFCNFCISGWTGYNSRFNGAYTATGQIKNERAVYSHQHSEGVGAGHDWCRVWYSNDHWRIGHVSWVWGDDDRCVAAFRSDTRDLGQATGGTWLEHPGRACNQDHGYPDSFKAAEGCPRISAAGAAAQSEAAVQPQQAAVQPLVVHPGVECDVSGQCPIVGARYHKVGEDYDLCEAEFLRLLLPHRRLFERIDSPGAAPVSLYDERVQVAVEVGPIWGDEHARQVAAQYLLAHPSHAWTCHWWTTVAGAMSVLQVDMPATDAEALATASAATQTWRYPGCPEPEPACPAPAPVPAPVEPSEPADEGPAAVEPAVEPFEPPSMPVLGADTFPCDESPADVPADDVQRVLADMGVAGDLSASLMAEIGAAVAQQAERQQAEAAKAAAEAAEAAKAEEVANAAIVQQALAEMGLGEGDLSASMFEAVDHAVRQCEETLSGNLPAFPSPPAASPAVSAEADGWKDEWDSMLEELEEMGFEDPTANREMLARAEGDIKGAIRELVTLERAH